MIENEKSKYLGIYRNDSIRLKEYDYSQNGCYFVTICTQDTVPYFSEVVAAEVKLTFVGELVNKYWMEIPEHFPFVVLDEYIIMPNHLHGIVCICRDEALPRPASGDETRSRPCKKDFYSIISPKTGSLSVIIGSFKSKCTKVVNQHFPELKFQWQSRFYEHIIRSEQSLEKIREYIRLNPIKWDTDEINPEYVPKR
ncbi:MAG: transposase [candidate division Zixibacteria bacterium]|nr:transposase [Candidatus Tariuqbacter arcticus]